MFATDQSGSRQGTFVQSRVARFGMFAGAIFFAALLARMGIAIAAGMDLLESSFVMHAVACAGLLGMWLMSRTGKRSHTYLRVVELMGLLVASLAIDMMGRHIKPPNAPELVITLALSLGMLARAIYVPSTPHWTLGLSVVVGLPLLATVYWIYIDVPPTWWSEIGGEWASNDAADIARGKAITTLLWWTWTSIVATAASKVIYGLRREISEAEQLGQYTLEEKLGEGAMGMVFRAHHAMLRRPTAIKLLLPDKIGEANLARFEHEVQQTARLTHPHTVTIYDYGRTPDGIFYYAMELLEGGSIDTIIEVGGAQPAERVAYIMDQVAAALAEAHGIGLIHRDIKPANIVITNQGGEPDVAKVVDFGLVKDVRGDSDPMLSVEEGIAGTPLYMSPETITAYAQVDARSDLYALGAVCYFMLTGEPVFKGTTAGEVCTHHLYTQPVPPSKRTDQHIPADLETIVLACLEKEPSARPQSANHVRARLWAGGTRNKWNTDRARRWWRKYGDAVRARQYVDAKNADESGKTIAIDLKRHRT